MLLVHFSLWSCSKIPFGRQSPDLSDVQKFSCFFLCPQFDYIWLNSFAKQVLSHFAGLRRWFCHTLLDFAVMPSCPGHGEACNFAVFCVEISLILRTSELNSFCSLLFETFSNCATQTNRQSWSFLIRFSVEHLHQWHHAPPYAQGVAPAPAKPSKLPSTCDSDCGVDHDVCFHPLGDHPCDDRNSEPWQPRTSQFSGQGQGRPAQEKRPTRPRFAQGRMPTRPRAREDSRWYGATRPHFHHCWRKSSGRNHSTATWWHRRRLSRFGFGLCSCLLPTFKTISSSGVLLASSENRSH